MPSFSEQVREVVPKIPKGKVATYSCIASLAGSPKAARSVGQALGVPGALSGWHRVVRKDGSLARIADGQRECLEKERVKFIGQSNRVKLSRHLWNECR